MIPLRSTLAALFVLAASLAAQAAAPVLLDPATADVTTFKTEKGPVLSVDNSTGAPALKVEFTGGSGYPGFDFPLPGGTVDLSAFAGIQADITNLGTSTLNVNLRADNAGDWKKEPWNTTGLWIPAGKTQTVKLTFGQSHGGPGYALDASRISVIKLFAGNPKTDTAILVKNVVPFGTATASAAPAATVAATPAPASSTPAAAPAPAADLFIPTPENIALVKTEKDPVLSVDTSTGVPALKVEFIGGSGYPGLDFPLTGGTVNLSAFAGIQADITNLGASTLNVNLRADNKGDWKQEPWNTNGAWIPAGKTQTVKLTFGQSHGGPGYALDASRISVIKLFAGNPKNTTAILLKNLRPFGVAGAAAASSGGNASTPAVPAASAGKDATFSPSIGGELLDLEKNKLTGFKYADSSAVIENGKIKVTFQAGSNYPNIQFPLPKGGWDLSAFGEISLTITNPNERKVTAYMRVDNPGHWKAEPWNTEQLTIGANETKTLKLTFGQQNGAPGFPLNSKRISAIQLFIVKPKADTTLLLSDLKGSGSPAAVDGAGLTSPADRTIPVTPPAWLGQRPPVEGDWVQTLNENFDGNKLNEKLWTPRFPWDGPQPGQLQRYAPQNVIVADGVVSFKSEKLHGHENNDPARPTREYTSGLIQSYDKFAQLYGYFEARVKLPTARGLWPAFWMMPDRGAASGLDQWRRRSTGEGAMEIDILEHLTEWGPGRNNVALHWDGYGANHKAWGTSHVYFGPTPDGWHVFGLLWEPGKLTWFIDGKKVVEYANERVSNVPSYIKLNTQMGGWATKDVDLSKLPDYFKVDYVRVWQLKNRP